MGVTAVVGTNWGDEGKGKMTDALAQQADLVIRYQGGANAGHTIINDHGRFALHLLPSGVFQPHTINLLGPGVALDIHKLLDELTIFERHNLPMPQLMISDRTQILMPYHVLFDQLEEERRGKRAFGSTQSGIAPFYSDKYSKIGIQAADLLDEKTLRDKIEANLEIKNVLLEHLYQHPPLDAHALTDQMAALGQRIQPMLVNIQRLLNEAMQRNQNILLEGQLGALRDPDHGIYPWVTSSSTLAGFGTVGAGVPPHAIDRIVGVTKAYSTCVGAGPFVTELEDATGHYLQAHGGDSGEYGATTGRARRVGWFDAVATKYGCAVQGATELAVTNLDVLSGMERIAVCDRYMIGDAVVSGFPTTQTLYEAQPHYQWLEGWSDDITHVRSYKDLPDAAKRYLDYIERQCDTRITYVSNGPHRNALMLCG